MPLTRRKTLALIGGGTILAAGTAAAGFALPRTPHAALAPWDMAGGYDAPRLDALSYGLLAPNPHNRQPWAVELDGGDGFLVWRDKTLDLPVTDPFGRQLTIGMPPRWRPMRSCIWAATARNGCAYWPMRPG